MHPAIAALRLRWQRLLTTPVADFARLPKVGGMSSIPTRAANLPAVLAEVLPQVDRLHLFLHGYDAIPEAAHHPKILPVLAPREHPFRASGKFYGLQFEKQPCVYIGFDDDILYHAGHVARLIRALKRYRGRVYVGTHALNWRSPDVRSTYNRGRRSYYFERFLAADYIVDVIGAGTAAFVSTEMPIFPPDWEWGDMDDLMVAIEAEKRHMPRVMLARPLKSIEAIEINQADSLSVATQRDDSRQTAVLFHLFELMGKWPTSGATPTPQ